MKLVSLIVYKTNKSHFPLDQSYQFPEFFQRYKTRIKQIKDYKTFRFLIISRFAYIDCTIAQFGVKRRTNLEVN